MLNRIRRRFITSRLERQLTYQRAIGAGSRPAASWVEPPAGPALVLAPHPDDEILGAGGTAALHARRGDRVEAAIVTDGASGGEPGTDPTRLVAIREAESRQAVHCIGFHDIHFGRAAEGLPEARIEEARWLGALIERLRPRVIYLPSPIDFHPDHALANDLLALTLSRGAPAPDQVAAFEVWSPILPNRLIDISATLEAKRRAIAAFPSQTGRSNIEGASLGIAAYRGLGRAGCRAAEAFWMSPPSAFLEIWESLRWH